MSAGCQKQSASSAKICNPARVAYQCDTFCARNKLCKLCSQVGSNTKPANLETHNDTPNGCVLWPRVNGNFQTCQNIWHHPNSNFTTISTLHLYLYLYLFIGWFKGGHFGWRHARFNHDCVMFGYDHQRNPGSQWFWWSDEEKHRWRSSGLFRVCISTPTPSTSEYFKFYLNFMILVGILIRQFV